MSETREVTSAGVLVVVAPRDQRGLPRSCGWCPMPGGVHAERCPQRRGEQR